MLIENKSDYIKLGAIIGTALGVIYIFVISYAQLTIDKDSSLYFVFVKIFILPLLYLINIISPCKEIACLYNLLIFILSILLIGLLIGATIGWIIGQRSKD